MGRPPARVDDQLRELLARLALFVAAAHTTNAFAVADQGLHRSLLAELHVGHGGERGLQAALQQRPAQQRELEADVGARPEPEGINEDRVPRGLGPHRAARVELGL